MITYSAQGRSPKVQISLLQESYREQLTGSLPAVAICKAFSLISFRVNTTPSSVIGEVCKPLIYEIRTVIQPFLFDAPEGGDVSLTSPLRLLQAFP